MMPMADLFPNVCVRERAKDGHSGTALGPGMMWRPMRRPRTEASSRFGKSPSKPQPQLGRDHLKPGCRTGAGAASIRDVSAAPAPPFANGRAVSRHSHVIAECLTATDPLRKSARTGTPLALDAPYPDGRTLAKRDRNNGHSSDSGQGGRGVEPEQQQREEAQSEVEAAAPERGVGEAEVAGEDQAHLEQGDGEDGGAEPDGPAGLRAEGGDGGGGEAEGDARSRRG